MIAALISLLYPPTCLLCSAPFSSSDEADQEVVCAPCRGRLPHVALPVCVRCGLTISGAFDAQVPCAGCRKRPPAFEMARAPWRYAGEGRRLIRQVKYHRQWRLGRWLADGMAATARCAFPLDDGTAVVPVPTHWLKRRWRGGYPVGELAQRVAAQLNKAYAPKALRQER